MRSPEPDQSNDLICYGTIQSVDLVRGRVTVRVGDVETGDLRWIQGAAGAAQIWVRPTVGEQVLLLAPDGDIEGAIAVRGVVSNAFPAIADAARDVIRFGDGAEIAYDDSAHALEVTLPGGGTARIVADGGVTLVGDVRIEGALQLTGAATLDSTLTAQGEIRSGDIKLTDHRHGQVQSGGSVSGVPQ